MTGAEHYRKATELAHFAEVEVGRGGAIERVQVLTEQAKVHASLALTAFLTERAIHGGRLPQPVASEWHQALGECPA